MEFDFERPIWRYEFTMDRADYAALLAAGETRRDGLRPVLVGGTIAGMGWGVAEEAGFSLPLQALIALALFAAVACAPQAWRWLRRSMAVARWKPSATPVRIDIHGDHICIRENGAERYEPWEFALAVRLLPHHAAIVFSKSTVLIPERAFEDHGDMVAFCAYAKDLLRELDVVDDARVAGAQKPPGAAPDDPLSVAVVMLPADVALARAAVTGARPLGLRWGVAGLSLLGGIIGGGVGFAAAPFLGLAADWRTWLACGWPGAALLTFVAAGRMEAALARSSAPEGPLRLACTFTIDSAGFTSRSAYFHTRIAWAGMQDIRDAGTCALFTTRWKETYAAPRRCFADEPAYLAFIDAARAWKAAAKED